MSEYISCAEFFAILQCRPYLDCKVILAQSQQKYRYTSKYMHIYRSSNAHIFIILLLKSLNCCVIIMQDTLQMEIWWKKDASLCTVSQSVLPLSLYSVYTVMCICTALCIFSLLYNEFLKRNCSLLSFFRATESSIMVHEVWRQ